jgi:hypothetical protein
MQKGTKRKTPDFTVKVQVRSFNTLKPEYLEYYQKNRLDDENYLWIPLTGYSINKLKERISVRSWAKFLNKYKQGAKDYLFTFTPKDK